MRLIHGRRNPDGALDALYLLTGDATRGPIVGIDADDGILPQTRPGSQHERRRLTLFHFNDLHNALQAQGDAGQPVPLFSRIVARYRTARAAAAPDHVSAAGLRWRRPHRNPVRRTARLVARANSCSDPAYVAYAAPASTRQRSATTTRSRQRRPRCRAFRTVRRFRSCRRTSTAHPH
jgi:hypothetical protein